MAKEPKDDKPKADETRKKRESRDYAQRAREETDE